MSIREEPGSSMLDRVTLEPMRVDHLEQVLEIEKASFPTPWSRRAFVSELTQNYYADYVVALLEKEVVGYAGVWRIMEEAHMTNIAVHPDYRGRRVGERLLQGIVERLQRRGVRRLTLEVRPSNEVAQRFYRKHGFQVVGVRSEYYSDTNEDALVMQRDLDAGDQSL